MTAEEFCQPDRCEGLKACAHVALGTFAGACFLYNASAFLWRRERHLLGNSLVYLALTMLEVHQVRKHLG